jgi:hypothetical protein
MKRAKSSGADLALPVGMKTRLLVVASVLLLTPLLLILLLPGCPGDYEVPPADEADASTAGTPYDPGGGSSTPSTYPDVSTPSSQADGWTVVPDTGYGGSPFGCVRDSDCFGLRCCATPWGVKLCQEVCPTKE